MKIDFLGTSHGVPMPGRHYQSICIETEKGTYLVDAGAPVMDCLINRKYDLTKINAVFVTHVHNDHIVGLMDMVMLASWYYKEMAFDIYMPEQRGVDAVEGYCNILLHGKSSSDKISYKPVKEGVIFDDGNLKVTAVPTSHMEATTNVAYGYLLEADGKRVYITGDMHPSLKDFPSRVLSEPVDVLISECAHFSAEALIEKLATVNAQKVMVVHVFPLDKYDVLEQYAKESPFELLLPRDGDNIVL